MRGVEEFQRVGALVRQTARYPIAAVSDGMAFRNSLLAVFGNEQWPAAALAWLLNSALVRWLHFMRFRDARLNSAAARELVTCHWSFHDRVGAGYLARTRARHARAGAQEEPLPQKPLGEVGWSVHHYFERDVQHSEISVSFTGSNGRPVARAPAGAEPGELHFRQSERVERSRRAREGWQRFWIEMLQVGAALLVPLATLASQTVGDANAANWWQLVVIGFASDTIKSILVGRQDAT